MLLESRSKPGNQIIKADKKRINMLKENTVPLIYIFDMSRDTRYLISDSKQNNLISPDWFNQALSYFKSTAFTT